MDRTSDGLARKAYHAVSGVGIDPRRISRFIRESPSFIRDLRDFRDLGGVVDEIAVAFGERENAAGSAEGHYFWQDLLVARRIFETAPDRHVDLGSRIDGFVAHLLTFRNVELIDIRDMPSTIPGMTFIRSDGMTLASIPDNSLTSVSSLHAIEHFGLGRYGDRLDPDGHLKAMRSLSRVLAPGGRLWLSFPIGRPRVEFNSQRVIDPELPLVEIDAELVSFTAIPSRGAPVSDGTPTDLRRGEGWCGLYEFQRPTQ